MKLGATLVGVLGVWAGAAAAFVESPRDGLLEVPLPRAAIEAQGTEAARRATDGLTARVAGSLGGQWQVLGWNGLSGTPRHILGSGVDLGVALASDPDVESAARQFLARHPEILGTENENLRLRAVRRGLDKVAVHFDQTHRGVPVWQAGLSLTFGANGRLFAMTSDYHRAISVNATPTLTAASAEAIAIASLPFDPSADRLEGSPELLVLPVPGTSGSGAYRLVWRMRVRTQEPPGIWVTHVDAHQGDIVWRYNDVHPLVFSGDAGVSAQPGTYCNGAENQPLKYARINVDGLAPVVTDGEGSWNAGEGGTGTRSVDVELAGPYANVNNFAGADATFTGTATAGIPFHIQFDGSNAQADERDTFDAVSDIHDFFEQIDPGFGYSNQLILANVSRIDGFCPGNAWWDGTINFCAAGGGYANTGEIQGVVHHEFGHGVQAAHLGWQGNEGLGEGNADILANILTQESIIGRGFFDGNCTAGIRNSDNDLQYPDDMTGAIHHDGQIIAGFHWDIMTTLQAELGTEPGTLTSGSLWHFARALLQPIFQPDQVVATFIVDDDDANLANGTPHYDAICDAATHHGFGSYCPEILEGVMITHVPVETYVGHSSAEVVATIVSTESVVNDVTLIYSINGGPWTQVGMMPIGNNEYWGLIPGFLFNSEVGYYLHATDMVGNEASSPRNAPDEFYEFDVAAVWDPMEEETGWVVNLDGLDNATDGFWVREDPWPTTAQTGDDHGFHGSVCWVTGNDPTAGAADDDVDGGTTTVTSPVYNLSGAITARVKYWRWFYTDQGPWVTEDFWRVEARNNGGPWIGIDGTQDSQYAWVPFEANLLLQFGPSIGNVQFRMLASDPVQASIVEAAFDDFTILADFASSIGVEAGPVAPGVPEVDYLADAQPNPFAPRTAVRYGLAGADEVSLEIFDVGGRRVRVLVETTQQPGNYAIIWDGTDDQGRALGAGTYYARLRTGRTVVTEKLTMLK